jgi:hypothetical protein
MMHAGHFGPDFSTCGILEWEMHLHSNQYFLHDELWIINSKENTSRSILWTLVCGSCLFGRFLLLLLLLLLLLSIHSH